MSASAAAPVRSDKSYLDIEKGAPRQDFPGSIQDTLRTDRGNLKPDYVREKS
jgi:hypothetical protein